MSSMKIDILQHTIQESFISPTHWRLVPINHMSQNYFEDECR